MKICAMQEANTEFFALALNSGTKDGRTWQHTFLHYLPPWNRI